MLFIIYNLIKHSILIQVKGSNSSTSNNLIQQKLFAQFKCQTVLFDSLIGPYLVLTLLVRVDLGVMALKGYSAFPKVPALLEPHYQIVPGTLIGRCSYPSAEMQSVNPTALSDWVVFSWFNWLRFMAYQPL